MVWSKLFGNGNDSDSSGNIVETFLGAFISSNMEIDELAKVYSEELDKIILKEMDNNLSYVGGNFHMDYINEKTFGLSFELFFQDENKEWVKKAATSKPQPKNYLTYDAFAELRESKKISFEIDPPKVIENSKSDKVEPKVRKMPIR